MRIVLDTNVLVSGLLSPFGVCAQIVRLLVSGEVVLSADARILLEYEEVLRRPRFGIDPTNTDAVMEFIAHSAEVHSGAPLAQSLPDPDDSPFLEVAIAAGVECLVTGNIRHYPVRCRAGVKVLSPAEFLASFQSRKP